MHHEQPHHAKTRKLPRIKGKKGVNDISIATIWILILFGSGLVIPFVNAEFGAGSSEFNTDKFSDDVQQNAENVTSFNAFTVLFTMFKLAFWDVGDTLNLPFWLDGLYTVISMMLIVLFARNIWIGGGG